MTPPSLYVSFPDANHFLRALSPDDRELASIESLLIAGLPPVSSAQSIGCLFGYSTRFVMAMAARPLKYYRIFQISRGPGRAQRQIESPRVSLKIIQTWFGHYLARSAAMPEAVHGFVPNRSTITAAARHANATWVWSTDLKSFFPSCSKGRVEKELQSVGYLPSATFAIAGLNTVFGRLAQGSPASPVIANLLFRSVDTDLELLAQSYGVIYTRYADDLIFSGQGDFQQEFATSAEKIVIGHGWEIADRKTQLQRRLDSLTVLGLRVGGGKIRLPKHYRNKLRQMVYAIESGNISAELQRKYRGHLAYASAVTSFKLG